ncbi:hypothetical protein JCM10450v2_008265 [Rhodotorula kratochvilovae]
MLERLPDELIQRILALASSCADFDDRYDSSINRLAGICRLSRRMARIAQRLLWEAIKWPTFLETHDDAVAPWRAEYGAPDLARFTRRLSIISFRYDAKDEGRRLPDALAVMPNLRELRIGTAHNELLAIRTDELAQASELRTMFVEGVWICPIPAALAPPLPQLVVLSLIQSKVKIEDLATLLDESCTPQLKCLQFFNVGFLGIEHPAWSGAMRSALPSALFRRMDAVILNAWDPIWSTTVPKLSDSSDGPLVAHLARKDDPTGVYPGDATVRYLVCHAPRPLDEPEHDAASAPAEPVFSLVLFPRLPAYTQSFAPAASLALSAPALQAVFLPAAHRGAEPGARRVADGLRAVEEAAAARRVAVEWVEGAEDERDATLAFWAYAKRVKVDRERGGDL